MLVPENRKKNSLAFNTAVIDIGSNSVRLVIYRMEGRSIWPVYNEKVLAGLGRDLKIEQTLNEKGKIETLIALRRFKSILAAYSHEGIHIVATAAIREALDGPKFCAEIFEQTGFVVRTLSGGEEAYYSAQGVICGHVDAQGIVGDLGGSSLELIDLNDLTAYGGVTLPLGPFALGAPEVIDAKACERNILSILEPYRLRFQANTFHAVGGAWRNLAIIWMQKSNYPLQIIQQFELPSSDALSLCRLIATQSVTSLDKIRGVTKRRMENLSYAALVMAVLIETFKFETICFSSDGLREGLLYDSLSDEQKSCDPLIEGCSALGARQGISKDLGPALSKWIMDFYDSTDNVLIERPDDRLIKSAAKLCDMGAYLHPDHRADLVSEQVLRAPINGQSHAERVFLACTLFTRYSGDRFEKKPELINRILGEEGLLRATQLGLALRLGCDLSSKLPELLKHARIEQYERNLVITADNDWADLLLGEQTKKRAKSLANALKLNLKIDGV